MLICIKCGQPVPVTSKSRKYCSLRCSILYLKSQWKKRTREERNNYNRKWRAMNPDRVAAWNERSRVKHHKDPIKRIGKERIFSVPCEKCPNSSFVSFKRRKKCPIHHYSKVTKQLRFEILKRDGFRCIYCGRSSNETALQVDHIWPTNRGGETRLGNLVTACADCNSGKGALPL